MDKEEIRAEIAKNGFLTLKQLKEAFQGDEDEILEMKLTALVSKNKIRQANFKTADGKDTLYYIPE